MKNSFKLIKNTFNQEVLTQYTKWLSNICLVLIVFGVGTGIYIADILKEDIDLKISQKESELDIIFDGRDKVYAEEIFNEIQKIREEKKPQLSVPPVASANDRAVFRGCKRNKYCAPKIGETFEDRKIYETSRYLYDSDYKELDRIKNINYIKLLSEQATFAWWGIYGLCILLLVNILVIFIKYLFIITKKILNHEQIKSMTIFQKYLVLIALSIVIILIMILIKLW
jgi:hypothetical protein